MPVIERIAEWLPELTAIRRHIHAHPELGFEEHETAALVVEKLRSWGIEAHPGIGGTGVVGVLKSDRPGRAIGLRGDMDALPMNEETGLDFASVHPGQFHGCGHDGHVTMLLGAARYLAETRNFDGTIHLIFQPAEEGLGGARAMIADGLFTRFPCDEIYALHNSPLDPPERLGLLPGLSHAGADFFDITLTGKGGHAAIAHLARDPIPAAAALVQALQTVVSRDADSRNALVLSVTRLEAGSAYNIIPETAVMSGTVRYLSDADRDMARTRIAEIADGVARGFGMTAEVKLWNVYDVLFNDPTLTERAAEICREVVGADNVYFRDGPFLGSEDFADMLKQVPGAFILVGQAGDVPVHNTRFILDDGILPVGASLLVRLAETRSVRRPAGQAS
jgi:hippurate hydrolase